ncbi:MAG: disulfide bond formation protein DsbA [Pseudomonas sp.]|uniref:DsbA family oxidoreductase n=1 Tax=Pseudomonas sp. TaxID=306 RepID=UPI002616F175|nr:DsbA family oxidoreductase [Pseudomonas sp.]MDB6047999.1 disulfide bond formation protein DsbA [Pseudomonas sp.]
MTLPVRIDFVSDVVCPWCALGAIALEQAIANLAGEVAVELTFKPFELNPDMPAEGEHAVRHMMRKYGRSAEEVASRNEMVIARGKVIGLQFDLEKRSHFYNTFDAHRLLLWTAGEGRQVALKKILLKAYFTDGQNPSDHETLVRLAGEAKLSTTRAREILATGEFANEVRELESFYLERGINSVPAMVLNGRELVSGSQSVKEYEQIIRQMARESATA